MVPVILATAAASLAEWLLADAGVAAALTTAIAALAVACPGALGLATPRPSWSAPGRAPNSGR